jgi:hypothetical protein
MVVVKRLLKGVASMRRDPSGAFARQIRKKGGMPGVRCVAGKNEIHNDYACKKRYQTKFHFNCSKWNLK